MTAASQAEGSGTVITCWPSWLALVDGTDKVVETGGVQRNTHARLAGRRTRRVRVHVNHDDDLAVPKDLDNNPWCGVCSVAQPCRTSCNRTIRSPAFAATRVKER